MKNYLTIVPKYLAAHKKKTRLTILSVAISVALITGIFSMVDVFLKFEILQVIHEYGNYHLLIVDAADQEKAIIKSRIDVKNSGSWKSVKNGEINGVTCRLSAIDSNFAANMNINMVQGSFPESENEIMIERWAADALYLNAAIGDNVRINFSDNISKEFLVSGIYNDLGNMKAAGTPGVFLSMAAINRLPVEKSDFFLVEFKKDIRINPAVKDIQSALGIPDKRMDLNTRLLAAMGQSENNAAIGLYTIGAVLFCLVLIAGVLMIYNTFNISVMERVRQFGLLRCIGASRSQIRRLVRNEGFAITLRAIPLGILLGMLMTFICSAILKFYNNTIFGEIPLFSISIAGIAGGAVTGFLTVFIASFLPAKKAARVSPVNAVTGSGELKIKKTRKKGWLAKVLNIETAMGINNAVMKRKTLLLMSFSIAVSIIVFLGFNVFIDFMYSSLKTTKPYTPDLSLTAEQGMDKELHLKLSNIEGVKRVYGRKFAYQDASFNAARLTDTYKNMFKDIKIESDGLFLPPEKSWLISYDKNQLDWAKVDLLNGELSEEKLNSREGVIAVVNHLRNNIGAKTAALQLGDKVYFNTPEGKKEFTVMGLLRQVPFSSPEPTLTTFIVTEAMFENLTGGSAYKAIDIQLKNRNDEQAVNQIKALLDKSVSFHDLRQRNAEINQIFLTMAVFVYGFVTVIALISILNIINTMNTSIASKTRYLGVLRAIGMSGDQLNRMVLIEAATYSVSGSIIGCVLGVMLHYTLVTKYLSSFSTKWEFPLYQIIVIFIVTVFITSVSIINPLKKIRANGISEVVNAM